MPRVDMLFRDIQGYYDGLVRKDAEAVDATVRRVAELERRQLLERDAQADAEAMPPDFPDMPVL